MMSLNREAPERQDIEALLPWHAAGTLSRRDSDRVEQALASDRELARRYELVREELNETIHLNETLGAPSARAMEKLFAAIDAEAPVAEEGLLQFRRPHGRVHVELQPAHAGLCRHRCGARADGAGRGPDHRRGPRPERAEQPSSLASARRRRASCAVVRFTANATLADVTRFLDVNKAAVVHGPNRGGLYEIQLAASPMPEDEFTRAIQRMKAESRIVEFIATKN